jgi:hypothetical protein
MHLVPCMKELRERWFPHATDEGMARLVELLEASSPLLIHGAFTQAMPMGCLATHIAWHHPETADLSIDAGIAWLSHVAGLNPATSKVIQAWDGGGRYDWELRCELLKACSEELARRAAAEQISAPDLSLDRELAKV